MKNFLLIMLLLLFSTESTEKSLNNTLGRSPLEYKKCKHSFNYNLVIKYIKDHEGFRSKRYMDGNNIAIGYGCHVKYHGFIPDTINQYQADSLLKVVYRKNLKEVKKYYPWLNKNQTLAIAHMAYAVGMGTIIKDSLVTKLQKGLLNDNPLRYYEYKLYMR